MKPLKRYDGPEPRPYIVTAPEDQQHVTKFHDLGDDSQPLLLPAIVTVCAACGRSYPYPRTTRGCGGCGRDNVTFRYRLDV